MSAGAPPPPPTCRPLTDAASRAGFAMNEASPRCAAGSRGGAARRWQDELRIGPRRAARGVPRARRYAAAAARARARSSIASSRSVWRELGAPRDVALVAVGGYGRGELFPHSDVDVLILLPGALDAAGTAFVERLIGMLLGHRARDRPQRAHRSPSASTRWPPTSRVKTSLLEHRCVAGSRHAASRVRPRVRRGDGRAVRSTRRRCSSSSSGTSKYHDAAYNLEPNVKESPGGLRDLQTVLWIARAAGRRPRRGASSRRPGSSRMQEARTVSRQERLIGALRVRLHYLAGPARGPARVRPAECARARARARRHADAARERAADAALLPRGQDRAAGQRHPAAEPARAALRRSPTEPVADRRRRSVAIDELLDVARRGAVRAPAGGDARRVPRRCSGIPS